MRNQRRWAAALIVVQAVTQAYMSGAWLVPMALALAAVLSGFGVFRLRTRLEPWLYPLAGAAILVAARNIPGYVPNKMGFFIFFWTFTTAQYLLAAQTIHVVCHEGPLTPLMPVLACPMMILAGNRVTQNLEELTYGWLSIVAFLLVFGPFCASYRGARPGRRGRLTTGARVWSFALLGVAAVTAVGMAVALRTWHRDIDQYLFGERNRAPSAPGVSRRPTLGSLNRFHDPAIANAVALRVESARSPGYLRGRVFTFYEKGAWLTKGEPRALGPLAAPPKGLPPPGPTWQTFRFAPGRGPWREYRVMPDRRFEFLFHPNGAAVVFAEADRLLSDAEVNLEWTVNATGEETYAVAVPERPPVPRLGPKALQLLRTPPKGLDPGVEELAARLFANGKTPQEKVLAVLRHLRAGKYVLGIEVPRGREALSWFLLTRPPAHCEFYASAATVLLRLGGVPTRYCTGFVAGEKATPGGYWIARNRDAHAWCEVYDPEQGWRIVEATPGDGVPQPRGRTLRGAWDSVKFPLREAWRDFRKRGPAALLALVKRLIRSPSFWVVVAVLVLFRPLRRLIRRLRGRRAKREDPALAPLRRLLAEVDRRLAKQGLTREPAETLSRFARRLTKDHPTDLARHAARFYDAYATVRYRGPINEETVASLSAQAAREGEG